MATLTTNLVTQSHFSRQTLDNGEGSVSMDSNDVSNNFDGDSSHLDDNSCCSNDTILSVGNENPIQSDSLSFKNIESHLNAISQITNSTLDPDRSLTKDCQSPSSPLSHRLSPASTKSISESPTPSYMYRSSDCMSEKSNPTSPSDFVPNFRPNLCSPISPNSQRLSLSGPDSPESLNQSPKPSETQHFFFRPNGSKTTTNNNDANNAALKFSIDNILKADFGRRITDPINIKKSKPRKIVISTVTDEGSKSNSDPVDLCKTDTNTITGKSSESKMNQPMLWPAWVYCTRYSDRPSSDYIYQGFSGTFGVNSRVRTAAPFLIYLLASKMISSSLDTYASSWGCIRAFATGDIMSQPNVVIRNLNFALGDRLSCTAFQGFGNGLLDNFFTGSDG
ncbi:hypothetical protein FQA39_LY09531 [Lamprigera yunnana]|nr:hypothetical protein FQA39_LY09531 [Lamprigera yunnana]